MKKPLEFQEQTTIQQETSFQVDQNYPRGPQAGTGVLGTGRVVWTQKQDGNATQDDKAKAFADGIGVISVAAESLKR